MAIHTLRRTQLVPASIQDCWEFFSNPANLARLTPAALDFQVKSEMPPAMHRGQMIEYRVRPLFGLPMTWLTEITEVEAPTYFVDEQRIGPYRVWHHEHHFRAVDASHTEIADCVHYVLPFSPFSEPAHALIVAPQLEQIFAFRAKAVREIFPDHETLRADA